MKCSLADWRRQEIINKHENRAIEIMQSEQQRRKKLNKSKQSLINLGNNINYTNIQAMRVTKGKDGVKDVKRNI